jgi:hypothetical protein
MEHFGYNHYQIKVRHFFMEIFIILFIYLASISSIRTKKTKKLVDKECCTVEDLLEANVGQDVQILVTDNISQSKEWISGKIKSVKRFQQSSDDEITNTGANPSSSKLFLPSAKHSQNTL